MFQGSSDLSNPCQVIKIIFKSSNAAIISFEKLKSIILLYLLYQLKINKLNDFSQYTNDSDKNAKNIKNNLLDLNQENVLLLFVLECFILKRYLQYITHTMFYFLRDLL